MKRPLAILLLGPVGLSIPELFLVTAVLNAIVAAYIFSLVPEFLMRFLVWLATLAMYRIDTKGIEENIPDEGPALVVCNHVGYMDALLLAGAIPVRVLVPMVTAREEIEAVKFRLNALAARLRGIPVFFNLESLHVFAGIVSQRGVTV
jgi:1-acyl-sn-glycerol-3-phosphate acyltransferase